MWRKSGFTIIEILIVITVLGLLASLAMMSYQRLHLESRDAERRADAAIFIYALERFYEENGEYPPGCIVNVPQCSTWPFVASYSETIAHLTSSTTKATMQDVLGVNLSAFGDPRMPNRDDMNAMPLYDRSTPSERIRYDKYVYFGGAVSPTEAPPPSGGTAHTGPYVDASFQCNPRLDDYNLRPEHSNKVSTYIFAYFSEVEKKWIIHRGDHGVDVIDGCNPTMSHTYRYDIDGPA